MAQDLRDLSRRLRNLMEAVPTVFTDLAITVSLNGKALAERTIREQGFGASYVEGSYKEMRAEKGLEVDWVTLAFTNVMWSGMVPSEVEISGSRYVSNLTHTNQEGMNKMKWNFERYGNFITMALELDGNEEKIRELTGFELNRIFNKYINE